MFAKLRLPLKKYQKNHRYLIQKSIKKSSKNQSKSSSTFNTIFWSILTPFGTRLGSILEPWEPIFGGLSLQNGWKNFIHGPLEPCWGACCGFLRFEDHFWNKIRSILASFEPPRAPRASQEPPESTPEPSEFPQNPQNSPRAFPTPFQNPQLPLTPSPFPLPP